jgi:hypothetical protein
VTLTWRRQYEVGMTHGMLLRNRERKSRRRRKKQKERRDTDKDEGADSDEDDDFEGPIAEESEALESSAESDEEQGDDVVVEAFQMIEEVNKGTVTVLGRDFRSMRRTKAAVDDMEIENEAGEPEEEDADPTPDATPWRPYDGTKAVLPCPDILKTVAHEGKLCAVWFARSKKQAAGWYEGEITLVMHQGDFEKDNGRPNMSWYYDGEGVYNLRHIRSTYGKGWVFLEGGTPYTKEQRKKVATLKGWPWHKERERTAHYLRLAEEAREKKKRQKPRGNKKVQ